MFVFSREEVVGENFQRHMREPTLRVRH